MVVHRAQTGSRTRCGCAATRLMRSTESVTSATLWTPPLNLWEVRRHFLWRWPVCARRTIRGVAVSKARVFLTLRWQFIIPIESLGLIN